MSVRQAKKNSSRPNVSLADQFRLLVELRMKEKGVQKSELARQAGVSRQYVDRVLAGTQNPTLNWAERAGKPLGIVINISLEDVS